MNTCISTYTGVCFNPLDPNAVDVRIEDIAHALANACRFTGHCRFRYSVAEHSVRVSELLTDEPLWGLLHDASEAYIVDLPSPLKRNEPLGPIYKDIERGVQAAICKRFSLPLIEPAAVRAADAVLLATEVRDLMPPNDVYWHKVRSTPLPDRIRPWAPDVAEYEFLRRYKELTGDTRGMKGVKWIP